MPENQLFNLSPAEFLSNLPTHSVWIAVAVIIVVTAIYSIVFLYHWKKYSIDRTTLPYLTVLVYIIGTLFLLSIIIGATITISL